MKTINLTQDQWLFLYRTLQEKWVAAMRDLHDGSKYRKLTPLLWRFALQNAREIANMRKFLGMDKGVWQYVS